MDKEYKSVPMTFVATMAALPHDDLEALRKDAERWRYVARHWFKAKQHWNNDPANSPRALTLEIRCSTVARGGAAYVEGFVDEAIAAETAVGAA